MPRRRKSPGGKELRKSRLKDSIRHFWSLLAGLKAHRSFTQRLREAAGSIISVDDFPRPHASRLALSLGDLRPALLCYGHRLSRSRRAQLPRKDAGGGYRLGQPAI